MNHPSGPSPADLSLLDDLGGCYQAAADAVAVVRGILDDSPQDREALEQSLELMAEAQSALRVAVERTEGRPDNDQFKAYQWLRAACWRLKIFIPRHMRVEDPADPTSWSDIDGRVERRLRGWRRSASGPSSPRRCSSGCATTSSASCNTRPAGARWCRRQRDGGHQRGAELSHDWKTVMDTVDQMVRDGVPPSNAEVRDLLLPVLDAVPETPEAEVPAGFERVMREIDRYVASRPAPRTPGARTTRPRRRPPRLRRPRNCCGARRWS